MNGAFHVQGIHMTKKLVVVGALFVCACLRITDASAQPVAPAAPAKPSLASADYLAKLAAQSEASAAQATARAAEAELLAKLAAKQEGLSPAAVRAQAEKQIQLALAARQMDLPPLAALIDEQVAKQIQRSMGDVEAELQAFQAVKQGTVTGNLATARSYMDQALYTKGTAAMDQGDWAEALDAFGRVAAQKGDRTDAALYWTAYCQNKLGQRTEALSTIQDLVKGYATSRWISDAKALELEVRAGAGKPVQPEAESDQELKLLALGGLISTNPDQVIPTLQKLVQSQQPLKVKKRALFVLSQSQTPKAREVLIAVAKGSANPDLQAEAITYLGFSRSKENRQLLAEMYSASADKEVKRRIIRTYMTSGERYPRVYVTRREGGGEVVRSTGGQPPAPVDDQLWKLYQGERDVELKREIIRAMSMMTDTDHVKQLARAETDAALRREAIRGLGLMDADGTAALMMEIYAGEKESVEIRREVLDGLHRQGNAKALVDIARKETNPALKKDIVSRLATMKSKEATDYLMELISK
jgi:tetratricopeptide (TPR) repeat protein